MLHGRGTTQFLRVSSRWGGAVAAIFILVSSPPAAAQNQSGFVPLQQLTDALVIAVSDVKKLVSEPPYFLVKQIDLELQGVERSQAEGGFSVKVFAVGVDLSAIGESTMQEKLSVQLEPAQTIVTGGTPVIDLSSLIIKLKEAFARKKQGSPSFIVKRVEWERSWTLQYGANGGINFVVASGKVQISKEKRQSVKFILCETLNLRDCAGS